MPYPNLFHVTDTGFLEAPPIFFGHFKVFLHIEENS